MDEILTPNGTRVVLPNALPDGYRIVGPEEANVLARLAAIETKLGEVLARVRAGAKAC